jgi:glutamate/tyrosine decarboxylase-like PLP-dependent enzyme
MNLRQSPFPADDFRAAAHQAVDLIADRLASIRDQPVYQPVPPAHRVHLMTLQMPDTGHDVSDLVAQFAQDILPWPMGNGHPRFFGWANSPPDPAGVIAEFLAAGFDPSCAGGDHASIYLERCVTAWLADLVGFPLDNGIGLLTSGGSMASLTAIAAARHAAAAHDGWNDRDDGIQQVAAPLVMYLSTEAHTTMVKAAELIGIGNRQVHRIPVDSQLRIDTGALQDMIAADRANGYRPFLVAASAGTVSTGAIDPFDTLADLCSREGLWLHIDGALGAVGVLDSRISESYAGMERADSLAIDPHKWLSVPVECGCILFRDAPAARDTFSLVPAYLRTEENQGIGGLPWFSEYGFQQTRGFRALKLWMTLAAAGKQGLVSTIRRHNDLTRNLAGIVAATPSLELFAEPTLCIVCFRVGVQEGVDSDAFNTKVMQAVQSSGRAFVTQAVLNGAFWLRASVMHYDTNEADIAALIETVLEVAKELESVEAG